MDAYWRLPGPARFVDAISDGMLSGEHALIYRSPSSASGLQRQVQARVEANGARSWRTIDLRDERGAPPVVTLWNRLGGHVEMTSGTVRALVESDALDWLAIWVQGIDEPGCRSWADFLKEYEQFVRNRGVESAGVFALELPAAADRAGTVGGVTFRAYRLQNVANAAEMSALIANRLRDLQTTWLHRRLAVALIAECAGDDPALALALADRWEPLGVDPLPLLQEEVRRQGKALDQLGTLPDWRLGSGQVWEDEERWCSCAVVVRGDLAELSRRTWKAQLTVLFPFIEAQRVKLLDELRSVLRVPFETPFGVVTDVQDLEVQHLLHQAYQAKNRVPRHVIPFLECLRDMRHALAHLEPVKESVLRTPELLRRLGPVRSAR
jgi:hypothetical protein